MKKTILTVLLLACFMQPSVNAEQISANKIKETIVRQSLEIGIDPALALSIAKLESRFNHETKSRNGAVGVFQLMPSTAKKLGVNPYHMEENVRGGLIYYKRLYQMFGSTELALAAYNAGPGNVKKYNKVPPFVETKNFISGIMAEYNHQKKYPDPVIAKVKNIGKINNHNTIPKNLPDTTKPVIIENEFVAPTDSVKNSEENII